MRQSRRGCLIVVAATVTAFASAGFASAHDRPFTATLKLTSTVASTVPANGDVNPYGVAVVPSTLGKLRRGDILVSNFNNQANLQGTGTTIVTVTPDGQTSLFAKIDPARLPGPCPGGVGLTTALSVLPGGWVVVGSLPTTDGTAATAKAGCLLILDDNGIVRETVAGHGINGPWDMTAAVHGTTSDLYVSNVLNGTVQAGGSTVRNGTVLRIRLAECRTGTPRITSITTIGSGFAEHTDPAALVVGPTGVGLNHDGTLYVADTADNRITAIPRASTRLTTAGTGRTLTAGDHLTSPLGLTVAPGGDILTVNGGDGNLVETTPAGGQIATRTLDTTGSPAGAGALFGLAVGPDRASVYFVDDASNTLNRLN